MGSFSESLSIMYKLFEFVFFLGMDIACLVIAIKGYKKAELQRTWLFLIWIIILGTVSYLFSSLFFNPFTREIWGYDSYTLFTIVSGITTVFHYVRTILFLLMLIWLLKKK
jgi:hypothetical protein